MVEILVCTLISHVIPSWHLWDWRFLQGRRPSTFISSFLEWTETAKNNFRFTQINLFSTGYLVPNRLISSYMNQNDSKSSCFSEKIRYLHIHSRYSNLSEETQSKFEHVFIWTTPSNFSRGCFKDTWTLGLHYNTSLFHKRLIHEFLDFRFSKTLIPVYLDYWL